MFTALALSLTLAHAAGDTAVRATFGDGQVLLGEVRTRTLVLATGSGVVNIPLSDVGEVVPVDDEGLGTSRGKVTVWLRNGSELRGTWNDPTLEMNVSVGGDEIRVDLPMNDLARFQLQGGTRWSNGPLYRLRTAQGDDLLVDPERTHVTVTNRFGTFSPTLAECRSASPVDEASGEWRIELNSGTVLVGELPDAALTVALPMGPESLTIPLAYFSSLEREQWSRSTLAAHHSFDLPTEVVEVQAISSRGGGRARPRRDMASAAPAPAADEWFDRTPIEESKAEMD